MKKRDLITGYILGFLTIAACASTGRVYRYYNLDAPSELYDKSRLLGKAGTDGWPDLDAIVCKPDSVNKMKCAILTLPEYFAMKNELEILRADLVTCQKGVPPT